MLVLVTHFACFSAMSSNQSCILASYTINTLVGVCWPQRVLERVLRTLCCDWEWCVGQIWEQQKFWVWLERVSQLILCWGGVNLSSCEFCSRSRRFWPSPIDKFIMCGVELWMWIHRFWKFKNFLLVQRICYWNIFQFCSWACSPMTPIYFLCLSSMIIINCSHLIRMMKKWEDWKIDG